MKTIFITGADGNLGGAVTKAFIDEGYTVIVTVINEAAKNMLAAHARLEIGVVNLMNEAETTSFILSVIEKYQKIDAALLLVGGFAMGNISATSGNELKKMYALNFETTYYAMRPLFTHMKENKKGRIVFVGARPAFNAIDGKLMIAYALSKSLLFSLASYMNEDAKGTNVVTTVVVPSTLDTAVNRKAMPDVDPSDWVKPASIAEVMKFICSDTADILREPIYKLYNNS